MSISTVILKPTKACNADCSYCSSPPSDSNQWSPKHFETVMEALAGRLSSRAMFIWHGGEPMLMGPDFYQRSFDIAKKILPGVQFAIQTNLLLYKSSRWKAVFREIFEGRISTSYDPDEKDRTIKGDSEKYTKVFRKKLLNVVDDDFAPLVVGTYTNETMSLAHSIYDDSIALKDRWYDFRVNYRYPAGRASGKQALVTPYLYGKTLVELYDRWIADRPKFVITPLDQMLKAVLGIETARCPWTNACGGRFLGIEPNGDVYNCADFADTGEERYRFGNIFNKTLNMHSQAVNLVSIPDEPIRFVDAMAETPAAREIIRRSVSVPTDCVRCDHFRECKGGCARDTVLYDRDMGGKFYYCDSWKLIFSRIKESVANNEAEPLVTQWGYDFEQLKSKALPYLAA